MKVALIAGRWFRDNGKKAEINQRNTKGWFKAKS
jgi:hypothetical protein